MNESRRAFLRQSLAVLGGMAAGRIAQSAGRAAQAAPSNATAPYELSCQTLPYRAHPLPRALEGIRKAGYQYVMIYQTHAGKPVFTPALPADERAALKGLIRDHALTFHMAFAGLGLDLGTEKGIEDFKKELDLCREFALRTVVGTGPWGFRKFPDEPKPADEWERETSAFYKGMEKVVAHAETIGITIALKPHTGITATAKACREVVKRIVSERFKICWDAGNVSYYEGIHPDPDLPALAPDVRAVCLKDHRGGRANGDFPVPGQGQVDHELMFKILFGAGFRGPLAVERIDGNMDAAKMPVELIDERIRQAREFLKPLLDKIAGL
jgi:sugar phosphate isomerase/epimerase